MAARARARARVKEARVRVKMANAGADVAAVRAKRARAMAMARAVFFAVSLCQSSAVNFLMVVMVSPPKVCNVVSPEAVFRTFLFHRETISCRFQLAE